MLVLVRDIGERIIIGDDIQMTILEINGRQVRLGFVADRKIPIHREEVYQRIQHEKTLENEEKE